jgi:hypothetical protein
VSESERYKNKKWEAKSGQAPLIWSPETGLITVGQRIISVEVHVRHRRLVNRNKNYDNVRLIGTNHIFNLRLVFHI